MQDIEKEARKGQYKLILGILLCIFLMITSYTVYWEIRYYTKYNHFKKVEATIIEHEDEDDKIYDVINYSVDNIEYNTVTRYESKNEVGDKIYVYYDINNPSGVIYSLDYRRYVLPIISVLMGGICVGFFVIYKVTYPRGKKKSKEDLTPVEILLKDK